MWASTYVNANEVNPYHICRTRRELIAALDGSSPGWVARMRKKHGMRIIRVEVREVP
jgi:hypothetical protein